MIKKLDLNNNIFHLVVGFFNCNYFKNSLDSLISNNIKKNIFILITGYQKKTEEKDREFVKSYLNYLKKKGIKFIFKEFNSSKINESKTGNLYLAYNYALSYCYKRKIKYLNIIQNDMQMLFWDKNLENILHKMFALKKDAVFFHTGFIRIGSHPFFFKENKYQIIKNLFHQNKFLKIFKLKNSIGDWGLYNIEKLKKINFKFKINETFIVNNLKKYNYNGYLIPFPFISVLPWPSYVRKNIIYGRTLKLKKMYFKKLTKQHFYKLARSGYNYFQEDVVVANNWWYLFPPIYTDLNIREYITIITNIKLRLKRNVLFYYNGESKKKLLNFFKFKNIKPNLYELAEIYILKIKKKIFSN